MTMVSVATNIHVPLPVFPVRLSIDLSLHVYMALIYPIKLYKNNYESGNLMCVPTNIIKYCLGLHYCKLFRPTLL